jgi:hypothetical protein
VPAVLQKGCKKILGPLLETDRIPRRSTRTALDDIELPAQGISPASTTPRAGATARQGAISEVVQTLYVFSLSRSPPANLLTIWQRWYTLSFSTFGRSCSAITSYVPSVDRRADQLSPAKGRQRCQQICRIPIAGMTVWPKLRIRGLIGPSEVKQHRNPRYDTNGAASSTALHYHDTKV